MTKINITAKDVFAAGTGVGAGVLVYKVAKEAFPKLVEKALEKVTKILEKK